MMMGMVLLFIYSFEDCSNEIDDDGDGFIDCDDWDCFLVGISFQIIR